MAGVDCFRANPTEVGNDKFIHRLLELCAVEMRFQDEDSNYLIKVCRGMHSMDMEWD